ncbi:unnamed protein product [Spodoptera exigua]|nr:unnamed protein product [Spodoptera exigua]
MVKMLKKRSVCLALAVFLGTVAVSVAQGHAPVPPSPDPSPVSTTPSTQSCGEKGQLAARPEPDPSVRRVAFRARLKEPIDHYRRGSIGLMFKPGLRGKHNEAPRSPPS